MQDLTIDTSVTAAQYQFSLQATDSAALSEWTPKLVARLAALPALVRRQRATSRMPARRCSSRSTAPPPAAIGVTPATLDNALYDAFGQRIVSTIFTQANQYRVILEAEPRIWPSALPRSSNIYLPSSTAANGQVPLSAVATITEQRAPLQINHIGQFAAATISFNVAPGHALGEAVSDAIRSTQPTPWACPPASGPPSRAPPPPSSHR